MAEKPDERLDRTPQAPLERGPFSRPLRIHEVSEKIALERRITATPEECAAIAADAGLPAVASLTADLKIARRADGRFDVSGMVEATLTEVCVVSLEPFETTLRQEVMVSFALPADARDKQGHGIQTHGIQNHGAQTHGAQVHAAQTRAAHKGSAVIDLDETVDPPDPIVGNTIDLGAVALEFLTLARDFYPKKPGVHFTDVMIGEKDQEEPSPFAALERFKDHS